MVVDGRCPEFIALVAVASVLATGSFGRWSAMDGPATDDALRDGAGYLPGVVIIPRPEGRTVGDPPSAHWPWLSPVPRNGRRLSSTPSTRPNRDAPLGYPTMSLHTGAPRGVGDRGGAWRSDLAALPFVMGSVWRYSGSRCCCTTRGTRGPPSPFKVFVTNAPCSGSYSVGSCPRRETSNRAVLEAPERSPRSTASSGAISRLPSTPSSAGRRPPPPAVPRGEVEGDSFVDGRIAQVGAQMSVATSRPCC